MDYIFDIDGTIADVKHRLHFIENGNRDWPGFFKAMIHDSPIVDMFTMAHELKKAGGNILVSTARPDDYQQETIDWMVALGFPYDKLYMRAAGDFRRDSIVKEELLLQMVQDGYDPKVAFDDKVNVIEMYRNNGLIALQCDADAEKISPYAGQTLLHVLVGPSGAGKSTYIAKNYKETDVVSSDGIRLWLFGDFDTAHTPENLKRTWSTVYAFVAARLANGIFTVLDATNIKAKDRLEVFKHVPKGVLVNYILIDRPLDDKLRDRGWRPESLVLKHHKTFQSSVKSALAGDDRPDVFVFDKREK
jgi:predicted kinase